MFTLRLGRYSSPFLCAIFVSAAYSLKKRVWVGVAAFLVVFPVSVYATARYVFLSEIRPSPLRPLPVANGRVVLGGDRLRLHSPERCFEVAVCFWVPESDIFAVAAHSCKTLPGSTPKVNDTPDKCPNSDPDATTVKVVTDSDFGLVLSGMEIPAGRREELSIGGSEDIFIGEEALLYTSEDQGTSVQVLGFSIMRDQQMLLVQVLNKDADLGPGASGSPLVQNGKIIGFLVGVHAFPYRGSRLLILRPACEVYSNLEEFLR
jgi:hypothetical protein